VGTLLIIGIIGFILYSVLGGTSEAPPTVSDVTNETLKYVSDNLPAQNIPSADGSGDEPPLKPTAVSQGGLTTPTPYPGSDSVFDAGTRVVFENNEAQIV